MPIQKRKPNSEDISYIDKKLSILKSQMDKAEAYLSENPWDEIEDDSKKEKEFKFQKDLSDTLMSWTESYINMCGIMDVYKQLEAAKNRNTMKAGMEVSGVQRYVKRIAEEKGKK